MYGSPDLTDEEWGQVVWRYEDGEFSWQSDAAVLFVDLSKEVRKETEKYGSEK